MVSARSRKQYRHDSERQLKTAPSSGPVQERLQRYWAMRIAAVIILTAGVSLLAAACGGSPFSHVAQLGSTTTQSSFSSNASGAGAQQQTGALAFSRCMRSHGLSKFPDPDSSGQVPKTPLPQLGVSLSQFVAAKRACERVLPSGGQPPPAVSRQLLSKLVKFAQCMRSHGVSNWPDPTLVPATAPSGGSPYQFDLQGLDGLDGRSFSPPTRTAMRECLHREHLTDVGWT